MFAAGLAPWWSVSVTLVVAVGFAFVARTLVQRAQARGGEPALYAFALWWACMSARAFAESTATAAAAWGWSDVALHTTLLNFRHVMLAAALWGLTSYLVAVYSGSTRHMRPLAIAYGALLVGLLATMTLRVPVEVSLQHGAATVSFAHDLQGVRRVLVGLVYIPIILSVLFYASLYWRTDDPRPRYRIALVSSAALVWATAGGIVRALGVDDAGSWPMLIRALSLAGTALVLLAYHPPAFMQARWDAWERRAVD